MCIPSRTRTVSHSDQNQASHIDVMLFVIHRSCSVLPTGLMVSFIAKEKNIFLTLDPFQAPVLNILEVSLVLEM